MNVATLTIDAQVSNRAALWLKLYAIAMMVLDHVDTGLLGGGAGVHATLGRTVFPVFAFLLAYNLARAPDPCHLVRAVAPRMAICGLIAQPFAMLVWGPSVPLNVMFTLSLATLVVGLIRGGYGVLAIVPFLGFGAFVDYGWFGVAAIVLGWFLRERGYFDVAAYPVAIAALILPINGNWWALLAAPLIAAVVLAVRGDAARSKWAFYAFYPAHLAAIAAVAWFWGVGA